VKPDAVGLDASVPHEGAFSGGALEGMGWFGWTGSPPVKKSSTNCKGARMVAPV